MFCKYCGNQVKENQAFCSKCGGNLTGKKPAYQTQTTNQTSDVISNTMQNIKDSINFNSETLIKALKITGIAYVGSLLISFIVSLILSAAMGDGSLLDSGFSSIFSDSNAFIRAVYTQNFALMNVLRVDISRESVSMAIRILTFLIIPILSYYFAHKVVDEESKAKDYTLMLYNSILFSIINTIVIIATKQDMFGATIGFSVFYSLISTIILVFLIELVVYYIKNKDQYLRIENLMIDKITLLYKNILILGAFVVLLNLIVIMFKNDDMIDISLGTIIYLLLLLPNVVIYALNLFLGNSISINFAIADLKVSAFSTSINSFGSEGTNAFALVNIILMLVTAAIIYVVVKKVYENNQGAFIKNVVQLTLVVSIINGILTYLTQIKFSEGNNAAISLGSGPMVSILLTWVWFALIGIITHYTYNNLTINKIESFIKENFKIILSVTGLVIIILTVVGYNSFFEM